MSALYNRAVLAKWRSSQPIYKGHSDPSRPPALIHKIEMSPPPQDVVMGVPRHSHVMIGVKVSKNNTVPKAEQFKRWLTANVPHYIEDITIEARRETESMPVLVILPIEIWLILRDHPAYSFYTYRPDWTSENTRVAFNQQPPGGSSHESHTGLAQAP